MVSENHCGSFDVLYLGHNGIRAAAAIGGLYLMTIPVAVLFTAFAVRQSPVMLPFHVFGGHEKLLA